MSTTTLNKAAAEVITSVAADAFVRPAEQSSAKQPGEFVPAWSVHALTDVTGFGLIGHAREMALASNVGLVFHSAKIPVLEGALDCIRAGHIPGRMPGWL
jgi:selenide,water dikinase